jgi:3-oxoadipate enol-lactonase
MGTGMWAPQLDAAPGWRVLTPPLPGFDGRPLIPDHTMDAYGRAVLDALDGAGIQRAVFGGLSLGGYVIFGILRQAPERVAGLILADTRTSADTPERRAARDHSIELARRSGASAIADEMLPSILGATTRAGRPDVVARVRALIEAQPVETIAAGLDAMKDRPDSTDVLKRVTVPTAIIVGDEDTITPPSDAEHMQRCVAGSTLVTIPRSGHMANLESPQAFNAAMAAALSSM